MVRGDYFSVATRLIDLIKELVLKIQEATEDDGKVDSREVISILAWGIPQLLLILLDPPEEE